MPNDPNPNGPDKPAEGEPKTGDQGTAGDQGEPARNSGTSGQGADVAAERAAREAAEKRATEAEAEAARLRGERTPEPKPESRNDLDALRTEIRTEFTGQLVRAEVRAAAAGKLRDPTDALALLDVVALVGQGGDIDQAAISTAVDQLVKDKPYLAAEPATETGPAPWGDVGAGHRESAGEPEPATPYDRLRRAYGDK